LRCKIDVLVAGGTRVIKRKAALAKSQAEKMREKQEVA
jgi:hypothetical protein